VAATVAATATAAEGGLDLARTTIRLESINSYSIVAALLLQATLKLYSDTPKDLIEDNDDKDEDEDGNKYNKRDNLVKILFVTSAGLSIICGAYTTVVFSLLGLYSKSALGMGLDDSFLRFYAATAIVRKRAFDSFLMALMSFEFCFALSLLLNYDGKTKWWSVSIATILAIWSWRHWQEIIDIAGTLLFR
jgi:hypothetical protein